MKRVKLKDFQDHAGTYLEELPIALTKYNQVIAVIISPEEGKKYIRRKKKTT